MKFQLNCHSRRDVSGFARPGAARLFHRIGIGSLALLALLPHGASANPIEQSRTVNADVVSTSIAALLPVNAKWALSVIDVMSGERLVSAGSIGSTGNDDLLPGSVAKLILTAAILDLHSTDKIDLATVVSRDGSIAHGTLNGNVYLKGSGNALLRASDIEDAVEQIRSQSISDISGDIIVDESLYDAGGWKSGYFGAAYATPSALGLDLNTVSVFVTADQARVRIDPPNEEVKVRFVPEGQLGIRQIDDLNYVISGVAAAGTQLQKRFPLQDPSLFAAQSFRTLLQRQGIPIKGIIRKAQAPLLATEIIRLKAPAIEKIVAYMNHESLNVVAENLFLLLGARKYGIPGSREKGTRALSAFMKRLDLISESTIIADGSGLSSENRVSSTQIATLLAKAAKQPWFNSFYASIPRAGLDGNIKDLGPQNGNVRAKTGQLRDAYGLAGYIDTKDRRVGFSFMVNVPGAELLWSRGAEFIALLERI